MMMINQYGFTPSPIVPPVVISNIKYGYLYNWYAASDLNIAPVGWHVPTLAEAQTLFTNIGGTVNINNPILWDFVNLKLIESGEIYWDLQGNPEGLNTYYFNGRGGGIRDYSNGNYYSLREDSIYWTITTQDELNSDVYSLSIVNALIYPDINSNGRSIRFIKNDSNLVPSLTDLDGNVYRTTKIVDQVWLADNWACTKLNDGTPLTNVTDNTAWSALITEGYCAYNNDEANVFL